MNYSKPHTILSLHCMKHALKEFIPFANIVDEHTDGATFTLVFTVKNPIDDSFVPHLEQRVSDLASKTTVLEMIEGNARDYLIAQGEKSSAHVLKARGERLVSVISIAGVYHCIFGEMARELWPTKILLFFEMDGTWRLVGACSERWDTLDQFSLLYSRVGNQRYSRKGEKRGIFHFKSDGTTWLEKGIEAREKLRVQLRELYREIGCTEKEYPGRPLREGGVFHLEEKRDVLFPGNRCLGDVGYIPYSEEKNKKILAIVRHFFEKNGAIIEQKGSTLSLIDIFGMAHMVSEIKKEQGKEEKYTRITLFYSLERVCALLLERE